MESKEDSLTPIYRPKVFVDQTTMTPFNPVEYDLEENCLEITNGLQINNLNNPIYKFLNEDSIFLAVANNLSKEVCVLRESSESTCPYHKT